MHRLIRCLLITLASTAANAQAYGVDAGQGTEYTCPACLLDVVGRDLAYPPPLSLLGHVGLIAGLPINPPPTPGEGNDFSVIEVLNNAEVINVTPLPSFQATSRYWGEAYGLPGLSGMTVEQSLEAVGAGLEQKLYRPRYTFSPFYVEGTLAWDANGAFKAQTRGEFRCDSFVNFLYRKGYGVAIYSRADPTITPGGIFHKFRSPRLHAVSTATAGPAAGDTGTQGTAQPAPPRDEAELATSLALGADAPEWAVAMARILDDSRLNRADKLDAMLAYVRDHREDPVAFAAALHMLTRRLHAVEVIPQLLDLYAQEPALQNRLEVLSGIAAAAGTTDHAPPDTEPTWMAGQESDGRARAQAFFVEQLRTATEPKLLEAVVWSAAEVVPVEPNLDLLMQAADRAYASTDHEVERPAATLAKDQYAMLRLSWLMSSRGLQSGRLLPLLDSQQHGSVAASNDRALITLLENAPPVARGDKVVSGLLEHLEHVDAHELCADPTVQSSWLPAAARPLFWNARRVRAIVNLQSRSEEERASRWRTLLVAQSDRQELAAQLLFGVPDDALASLTATDRDVLRSRLTPRHGAPSTTDDTWLRKAAVERLAR